MNDTMTADEKYLDEEVTLPEPGDPMEHGDGKTVDNAEEDRQLTLQGLEEGDELGVLVTAQAEQMVRNAVSQLGVAESGGDNRGTPLTRYVRYFATSSGPQPWCGFFASWCWDQATDRNHQVPWGNPGYTGAVQDWGRRAGRLVARPQRGDLYGYRDNHHMGIVESASSTTFTSIDGNWGAAVRRQTGRPINATYFFVRL